MYDQDHNQDDGRSNGERDDQSKGFILSDATTLGDGGWGWKRGGAYREQIVEGR